MSDWTDDGNDDDKENEDFHPPKKKMCNDLSRKVAAKDCFAESISNVEYAKMTKQMVPRHTQKSTGGLCETSRSGLSGLLQEQFYCKNC